MTLFSGEILISGHLIYMLHDVNNTQHFLRVTYKDNFDSYEFSDGRIIHNFVKNGAGGGSSYGDARNNYLEGGAGPDYLYGGDGDDVLDTGNVSGAGVDVLVGGAGNDVYIYNSAVMAGDFFNGDTASSADRLLFEDMTLFCGEILISGNLIYMLHDVNNTQYFLRVTHKDNFDIYEFSDGQIIHNFEKNSIYGGSLNGDVRNNYLEGNTGSDVLYGGDGDDVLDAGNVTGQGIDTLIGGAGNDTYIYNSAIAAGDYYNGDTASSADRLLFENMNIDDGQILIFQHLVYMLHDVNNTQHFLRVTYKDNFDSYEFSDGRIIHNFQKGTTGNDTLSGDARNNYIEGDAGDDTYTLGDGSDIVKLDLNFGHDVIADFNDSEDILLFSKNLFQDFADLVPDMQTIGGDTIIIFDASNSLTLTGVDSASLTADDFLFA
jgi:Ca2+-binding RTX toxin-like protein